VVRDSLPFLLQEMKVDPEDPSIISEKGYLGSRITVVRVELVSRGSGDLDRLVHIDIEFISFRRFGCFRCFRCFRHFG